MSKIVIEFGGDEPALTLPDDIAAAMWAIARRQHRSIASVVVRVLREGLDLIEQRQREPVLRAA